MSNARFMFQKDDEMAAQQQQQSTAPAQVDSLHTVRAQPRLNDNEYEVKRVKIECPVLGLDLATTGPKVAYTSADHPQLSDDFIPGYVKEISLEEVRGLRNDIDLDLGFGDDFGFAPSNNNVDDCLAFEWDSKGWLVGNAAADTGAELGVGGNKTSTAIVKLIATCIKLGFQGEIAVGLAIRFIDQAQFAKDQDSLIKQLEDKTIHWRYMGHPGSITIPKGYVSIMPEGFAAIPYAIEQELDIKGRFVLAADLGQASFELSVVDGSKGLNLERNISGSLGTCGVHQFVKELVEAEGLPSSESHLLISAIANGNPTYSYYDSHNEPQVLDLLGSIPTHKTNYCKKLHADVVDWLKSKQVFERVNTVLIFGGGGKMLYKELSQLFKGKEVILLEPARFANAYGLHILMKKRVAKALLSAR